MQFIDPKRINNLKRDYKKKIIGGSGGGALYINCKGSIIINNYKCKIQCNGNYGNDIHFSGSGSGGSIYLKYSIDLLIGGDCIISAIGGDPQEMVGYDYDCIDGLYDKGRGGNGRIYIEYNGKNDKYILNNAHRIMPRSVIFSKLIEAKRNYDSCFECDDHYYQSYMNRSRNCDSDSSIDDYSDGDDDDDYDED
eukprot:359288_1